MTIIPMRDLKDTVEIERKCRETDGPVFVTKNGYGKLVVMSIDHYEKLIGELREAKAVNEGLKDIASGNIVDGDEVKTRISDKYGL